MFIYLKKKTKKMFACGESFFVGSLDSFCKGGFPLGKMNGYFATKFIWACTFLFVYSLVGKIFLFKIIKIDLTNSRRKNCQNHQNTNFISIFALSANTFQSDQIEDGC